MNRLGYSAKARRTASRGVLSALAEPALWAAAAEIVEQELRVTAQASACGALVRLTLQNSNNSRMVFSVAKTRSSINTRGCTGKVTSRESWVLPPFLKGQASMVAAPRPPA